MAASKKYMGLDPEYYSGASSTDEEEAQSPQEGARIQSSVKSTIKKTRNRRSIFDTTLRVPEAEAPTPLFPGGPIVDEDVLLDSLRREYNQGNILPTRKSRSTRSVATQTGPDSPRKVKQRINSKGPLNVSDGERPNRQVQRKKRVNKTQKENGV